MALRTSLRVALLAAVCVLIGGVTYTAAARPKKPRTNAVTPFPPDPPGEVDRIRALYEAGQITPARQTPPEVLAKTRPSPPVEKGGPGADARRLAVEAARQAAWAAGPPPWKGTDSHHNARKFRGESGALAARITAAFKAQDPSPDWRAAYFAWVDQTPAKVYGWHAEVEGIEPAESGHTVTAVVVPLLWAPQGSPNVTWDSVVETYVYNGLTLRPVRFSPPRTRHPGLVTPPGPLPPGPVH